MKIVFIFGYAYILDTFGYVCLVLDTFGYVWIRLDTFGYVILDTFTFWIPRDHIQKIWILVSKNLSFVSTSRTKWPRIQNVQNLDMFWILVSKIAAVVFIFVWFLQQKLRNNRIQTYPKQQQTYPKPYQNVSKTHCARIQKSYPKKDKRIQKRPKSYPNVSKILDTKRIQNWIVSKIYVSKTMLSKCDFSGAQTMSSCKCSPQNIGKVTEIPRGAPYK